MEVKAKARYIHMSPRKIRLIVDLVRGMGVKEARNQLRFNNKLAAGPVLKLLESAIANAIHNFKLVEDDLFIKVIVSDQGPTIKRWRPRAFGRATPIRKRTTHISIILGEKGKDDVKNTKVEEVVIQKKQEEKNVVKQKSLKDTMSTEEKVASEDETKNNDTTVKN